MAHGGKILESQSVVVGAFPDIGSGRVLETQHRVCTGTDFGEPSRLTPDTNDLESKILYTRYASQLDKNTQGRAQDNNKRRGNVQDNVNDEGGIIIENSADY